MKALSARGALSVIAVLGLAGCGSTSTGSTSPGEATGTPYVVGFQGGLTGSVSADPISRLDGMNAYFAQLNNNGGINNHPVHVVARDDTGQNSAKATTNFIEFRDQLKVPVIAGWTVSNVADAVIGQADAAQIPLLIGTGDETTLTHPYAYLVDTLFSQEAVAEINYLKTLVKPGTTPKIALFAATSAAGRTLDAEAKKDITANGWDLVLDQAISTSPIPADMVPQANAVVAAKADYVIGGIFLSLPVSFMRTLAQQNWSGKVINFRGGSGINYLTQVNDPNYYVVRSYAFPTDPASKSAIDEVKLNGGDPNGDSLAGGWAMAAIIAKGLAQCGFPCTGANMKKALDGMSDISNPNGTLMGDAGFTPTDHCGIRFERVYNWVNGAPAPVAAAVPVTCPVQTPAS
jgi:branched-chain amino acid transport system substrate-binding protein